MTHAVIETPTYEAGCKAAGVTEEERHSIAVALSDNPLRGDLIEGTGGARKWRFPRPGMGKRSGYRIVSYYAAEDVPVFLLDIYAKGNRITLTKAERNELKQELEGIAEDYRASVREKVARLAEKSR